jgi:hypothetical protein
MLNYNYNWIEPLQKSRNFLLGKLEYVWSRTITTAAGTQSGSIIFATGSIEYIPFGPNTLFVSGTYETQKLTSGSALGLPVTTAITGSGTWPLTGSNIMNITIGGNLGFNQQTSSIQTANRNNFNLSGSKISSSFNPEGNQSYTITFGANHVKGNIYNPLINWNAVKTSPFGNNISVNGEISSSFNLVENTSFNNVSERFTNLAYIKEVSGSAQSSSFYNEYSFNVTASYTASINNVTGSTTMSFDCPEEGLSKKVYFFNPNTTIAIGSASFAASNDSIHYFSSSINYNKGNVNNGPINWSTTNLSPISNVVTLNGYTASFNLVKDKNVSIINIQQITGSRFGTFNNEYAFNFTSSLTASIQSDATGSVTMSLQIPEAGISTSSILFSATSAGVNTITASFDTRNENPYNITASVIFNKGNISNVPNNWKQTAAATATQDLETDTTFINGNSSSFNIIKDKDVSVIAIPYASQSNSGTFTNNYAFNITSSLTASILPNTTGSVTMSLEIPEIGFSTSSLFFNWTSTGNKILSASFVSTTASSSFNITASIINNKGNTSNSNISWLATGSVLNSSSSLSASLGFRKDATVQILNVNSVLISTASKFKNTYAFNITSSLTGSYIPYYTPDSSSFYFAKSKLVMPEIGVDIFSYGTSSLITGSFAAQTNVAQYNVTGSIDEQVTKLIEYVLIGGGGGGVVGNSVIEPGAGGGAGALLTGSIKIIQNQPYTITIGKGGLPFTNGNSSSLFGPLVPYDGTWTNNYTASNTFLIAPGGGYGGYGIDGASPPSTGGSGGGGAGFGVDQLSRPPSAGTRPGALAVSSSVLDNTMTASFININAAGTAGSAGGLIVRQSFPGFNYGVGGTGGGKPTYISWLNSIINNGFVAGGGGGGNQWSQGTYLVTSSFGGGSTQTITGVEGNATQYTGGGGGGGSTYNSPGVAGYGATGSMSIRYAGAQQATGGIITSADGYTIHTFTSSAEFTWTN